MSAALVGVLIALAALSLGLRTINVLIPRVHPLVRLLAAAIVGAALALAVLRACDRYGVYDLGSGILVSLSPVGVFDLAKWWLRWKK